MSGRRRLAIFASGLWVVICLVMEMNEPYGERWGRFAVMAGLPTVLPWGIWWVRQGFKRGDA